MLTFEKLNDISGFDRDNLVNAKQNNYAWSMAEFKDYIYVGTGRNLAWGTLSLISLEAKSPLLLSTSSQDNSAEIWRYKKDGTMPWERVYKAPKDERMSGFRYLITHESKNCRPALYAASLAQGKEDAVRVLKTTDGSNWKVVSKKLKGASSRAMLSYNGILYLATLEDNMVLQGGKSLLYASRDPEFFDFELVTDSDNPSYIEGKNPTGGIYNMEVFNNRIYLCTSSENGVEVWRTNGSTPKVNEWTKVIDNGFGDAYNSASCAMSVYKDHLYVSVVKKFPLILLLPLGGEVVRLDKNDKWELVIGGEPIEEVETVTGKRNKSLSGYSGGFSNPFNLYIWQLEEYKGKFYATTFDHGTNMEALRGIALLNKDLLVDKFGETVYNLMLKLYDTALELFEKFNYKQGFSIYSSSDGINFIPLFSDGLGNENNYGGRILMAGSDNKLYVGTANPYDGCEVFRSKNIDPRNYVGNHSANMRSFLSGMQDMYSEIEKIGDEILKNITGNANNK